MLRWMKKTMATRTVYDDRKRKSEHTHWRSRTEKPHGSPPPINNQPIQFNLLKKEKLIKITLKKTSEDLKHQRKQNFNDTLGTFSRQQKWCN